MFQNYHVCNIFVYKDNKIFVAKRIDNPQNFWQMPQGGVDNGEDFLSAAYRELEAFAKFGSDLDAATLGVIEKGRRNVEILKQAQNDPFKVEDQVAMIYAGSNNLLKEIPVEKVKDFEKNILKN